MQDILFEYYLTLKALHIIAFTSWMAGMFYLPRLYVYHTTVKSGSEASEKYKIMERKLLRFIMNPAMIVTFIIGGLMLYANNDLLMSGWMHAKLTCVFLMAGAHGYLSKVRKDFDQDKNTKSEKFFRYLNEVPTLLFIAIIFLAVLKPF